MWLPNDLRYEDNSDGLFNFIPKIHRPNQPDDWNGLPWDDKKSNWKPYHEDWPVFRKTLRTKTSYIFISAQVVKGSTSHLFEWQGIKYPKPWCLSTEEGYTAVITFKCPVTGKAFKEDYEVKRLWGNTFFRIGSRISDDGDFVYVNKFPGPRIFTAGSKKL